MLCDDLRTGVGVLGIWPHWMCPDGVARAVGARTFTTMAA